MSAHMLEWGQFPCRIVVAQILQPVQGLQRAAAATSALKVHGIYTSRDWPAYVGNLFRGVETMVIVTSNLIDMVVTWTRSNTPRHPSTSVY
jgi:hypothetical protein